MAWDHGGRGDRDAVYTQTNNPAGNTVVVFDRHDNGTLTQSAVVPTGGTGTASQPPFGFPIVDSQDSVKLTDDGRLLFVVNSGDNSVSSFRVRDHGLRLADHFVLPAGNVLPISLAASGNVLYVLNGLSGNIYGMRFDSRGDIWGIPGSSQFLSSGPGPTGIAADIGFAPGGRVLAVSERCYDLSAVAPPFVGCPAATSRGSSTRSRSIGAAWPGRHRSIVSSDLRAVRIRLPGPPSRGDEHRIRRTALRPGQPGQSDASSTAPSRPMTSASRAHLAPGGTVSSGGRGLCWIVITSDGRYTYATNSLSDGIPGSGTGTVSRFALSRNGTPTLLDKTAITASSPAGAAFGTDLTLSADNRYLYVLAPTLGMLSATDNNDVSHIDVYRVGRNGSLTHIQATPGTLPAGVSGLGAS